MDSKEISRRYFLLRGATGLSAAWVAAQAPEVLAAQQHAHQAAAAVTAGTPPAFQFFTPVQAAEVEALAAEMVPSDDTPGAREAGVVYFIDRALTTFDREHQKLYVRGLRNIQFQVRRFSPRARKFSELPASKRIELLKSIEHSPFFEQLRTHTLIGLFANPEYGGNRGQVGWKLLGFEDKFAFTPPFGFYDSPDADKT